MPHDPGSGDPAPFVLNAATNEVLVQEYVLTAIPVVRALTNAAGRGVVVRCVLDDNMARQTNVVAILRRGGVHVKFDAAHCIAHNKVVVADNCLAVCGSYNLTASAEVCNAENMLFIRDPAVVRAFHGSILFHEHHAQ